MAGFKLALDAGHYKYTSGRRCLKEYDPKETREWELNDRVCDWIAQYAAQYDGFETMRVDDPTGEQNVGLHDRAEAANKWQADLYYSAHHNAGIKGGSGGGVTAYANKNGTEAASWRDGIYDAIIASTGLKGNRATPRATANFTVLTATDMPAVLIEHGFMDSPADIPVIIGEEFPRKVGEAVAVYIADRAGLKKKEGAAVRPSKEEPEIIDPPTEPEAAEKETAMTAIDRVIARARGELGYIEKASNAQLDDKTANVGSKNYTKYARDLDALGIYNGNKQGFDWCDVFADWCYIMEFGKDLGLKVICQPEKSYGAGVNSSAKYYKAEGRLSKTPTVGDQVYFIGGDGLYYHTGLVVAMDDTTITTIEGNAGTGSTRVVETTYKRTDKRLGAFGHPRWELVEDIPATEPPTGEMPDAPAEPAPAEPAAIALGDKVTLNAGAKVYGKDYEFSTWVYDRVLYVRGISGDKVTVSTQAEGAITGNVAMADVKLWGKAEKPVEEQPAAKLEEDTSAQWPVPFKVGDKVRIRNHAKNYSGTTEFSAWVYLRDLYIIQLNDDRAVISTKPDGDVTGAVNVVDLRLA